MIEAEILRNLQQGVTAAVQACTMPTLAVQYIDVEWEQPDAATPWLELVYLPNNGPDQYWGAEKQYAGALRMILHWPIKGAGAYKPLELVASIAAYFRKDVPLGRLQITDAPDLTGVLPDPPYMLYPVTLRYTRLHVE